MFPAVIDIPYKLARKILTDQLYSILKRQIGREKKYHISDTYRDIFNHYLQFLPDLKGKVILEIGCGNQLFTALQFLNNGASRIFLVEPKLQLSEDLLNDYFKGNDSSSAVTLKDAKSRISAFKYLESVPDEYKNNVDYICSHFVLEHFNDLESYFSNVSRLLKPDGIAYSLVDLSDHTFHLFNSIPALKWIYEKYPINHLRYSNKMFRLLDDSRIAVNRKLLPDYYRLARKYGLNYSVNSRMVNECYIHKDLCMELTEQVHKNVYVSHFGLLLTK